MLINGVEVARQFTRNSPTAGTPGYYTFDYLIPGNYYVTFFPVNDWLTTVPGTPSIITGTGPEMNDSQPAAGLQVGRSQTVTLAPGDNNPQLDAGFYAAEAIPTLGADATAAEQGERKLPQASQSCEDATVKRQRVTSLPFFIG